MKIPIAIVYSVLHNFCFADKRIAIRTGFLCKGKMQNPQIPLKNVVCHLSSGVNKMKEKLESQCSPDITQNNVSTSYNCIILDDERKYWWDGTNNFIMNTTFIFENDDVCLTVYYPFKTKEQKKIEKISVDMYEMNILKLSFKFFQLAVEYIYRNDYFLNFETSYRSQSCCNDTKKNFEVNNKDELWAQNLFLQQLDHLEKLFKNAPADKKVLQKNIEEYYSTEKIKLLIGDTNNNDIYDNKDDLILYNKKCLDIYEETLKLFQRKKDSTIKDPENKYFSISSAWSKIMIFDLNLAEIQKSNPSMDVEKIHIEPSDLSFINRRGKEVEILTENIFITKKNDLNHAYVTVNFQTLQKLKVYKFIIKKFGISVGGIWGDEINYK